MVDEIHVSAAEAKRAMTEKYHQLKQIRKVGHRNSAAAGAGGGRRGQGEGVVGTYFEGADKGLSHTRCGSIASERHQRINPSMYDHAPLLSPPTHDSGRRGVDGVGATQPNCECVATVPQTQALGLHQLLLQPHHARGVCVRPSVVSLPLSVALSPPHFRAPKPPLPDCTMIV